MAERKYLWFIITFNEKAKKHQFRSRGNVKPSGKISIIETFLQDQIGKGKDESKRNEKNVYHIKLKWYSEDDKIIIESDTGNKGLTTGILMAYLKRLNITLK